MEEEAPRLIDGGLPPFYGMPEGEAARARRLRPTHGEGLMPYEAGAYVRLLRTVSGRNMFSAKKRITAKAGTLGNVWQDAGNGWYEVDFSYTKAFPDLAGLVITEADLAPCSEAEANSVRAQREAAAECARKAAEEVAKSEIVRKPEIEELDTIRLTVPLEGRMSLTIRPSTSSRREPRAQ